MSIPLTTAANEPFWVKASGFTRAERLGRAYLTTSDGSDHFIKNTWVCMYEQQEDISDSYSILTVWNSKIDVWLLLQDLPFSAGGPSTIKYWDGPGQFELTFPKSRLLGTAVYDTTWHPGFYHLLEEDGRLYTVVYGGS